MASPEGESKLKLNITATGPGGSGKTKTLLEIQRLLIGLGFITSLYGDDHRLTAEKTPRRLYQEGERREEHPPV